jgi:tetratricopeptide (TPR) repeat protein
MAITEVKKNKVKIGDRLEAFIQKNRIPMLVTLAVLVVVLAAYGIVSQITVSVQNKANALIESVEDSYTSLKAATDEAQKTTIGQDLVKSAEQVIAKYPKNVVSQRARSILGDYWFEKKDFAKAVENYQAAGEKYGKNYLSAVSLFNAAVSAEEKGDTAASLALYEKIVADFGTSTPLIPHALFSIGRIYEVQKNYVKASAAYAKLDEQFPGESWTNMAKDRIIYLTAQNLLKK